MASPGTRRPRHDEIVGAVADHRDLGRPQPVAAAKACTMSGAGFGFATES